MYLLKQRIERILKDLSKLSYADSEVIEKYRVKYEGSQQEKGQAAEWQDFINGEQWGGRDIHLWFQTEAIIPDRFAGKKVVYEVKTGREGQWDALNPQFVIYVNGELIQGLDVNHREITLSEQAKGGEKFLIELYAYSGMQENLAILTSKISVLETEVEALYYDIKNPLEVVELLPEEDPNKHDILELLNTAVNQLDLRKPYSKEFYASIEEARVLLKTELYEKPGTDEITAYCVGHTHIDVAWLWTVAQTREKTVRSFSTVLNLMKQYPEYVFMSSQPQLYQFLKEEEPDLYEQVKERIKEGRWEAEGAMWLEADCNLISGESLVRQILHGTRFFKQEFDVESKILWLPDVFGYSAALPQILKKSGIQYFMTTKISWNEYNKVPCDTFQWRGIDGTEILTHFITTTDYDRVAKSHGTTYNGNLNVSQVKGTWLRYQQKDISKDVLLAYGYGDGGGGPTKEMIENGKRLQQGIPGCPKVKMGTALEFFQKLEKNVESHKRLPKWVGELYLEYHRGTYTSMARNKKYNRKSEFLYQDAEWLSTMNLLTHAETEYPVETLREGWETILLNQFHDIIPGSSIYEVYEDSKKDYERILAKGQEVLEDNVKAVMSRIHLESQSVVVFNSLGFERSDIVSIDLPEGYGAAAIYDLQGNQIPSQGIEGGKILFFAQHIPAKGYKSFRIEKAERDIAQPPASSTAHHMSNPFFDIVLDEEGNITSIYDRQNERQVLKSGMKGNVLQAFEDKPITFDAWDINFYYQEKMWEVNHVESIELIENGPVRSAIRIRRRFLDSTIVQDIRMYQDLGRIDFATYIDWKEKSILLKAAFPVDVHADQATYEIQYGNVQRPTHWNTSWDAARFEVCAHKWADLSEDGYGVSLLNDCKYGHDIKDSTMRLTLLKSAEDPNIHADREEHEFIYALYPHGGDFKAGNTIEAAYGLNCPLYARVEEAHEGTLPDTYGLVSVDQKNVVIEVVKKAEDSDHVIVRMYECYNRRSTVTLTFGKALAEAAECDLMERELFALPVQGHEVSFEMKPFEIKTLRLKIQ